MTPEEKNLSPEDMRKAMRAIRVRMRNTALRHFELVDHRTALVLQDLGLFEDKPLPFAANVDLAVLRDPQHKRRVNLSEGPLILYVSEEDDSKRIVDDLPMLFLSDSRELRQAALECTEKMFLRDPLSVTPKTLAILNGSRDALMSDFPADWRPAAVAVSDALYDDVLIALRGTRQSLECDPAIKGSLDFYTPKVIHPSVSSLDSISFPIGNFEKNHTQLKKILSEIVTNATSVTQLCHTYLIELGFLPLAPSYSLAAAVERWLKLKSEADIWTSIWDWSDTENTPLSRYHACSVFVRHPELIPDGKLPVLWNEVIAVVHDSDKEGKNKPESETWALRRDLAQHYVYHLEARLPDNDGANIACFAWWYAEQVAAIFPNNAGSSQFYREKWVKPALDLSSQIWLTASSPIQRSLLRYITFTMSSPWAAALLILMGEQFEKLAPTEQEEVAQTQFHEAVISNAIFCLPFVVETPKAPTFAMECSMADAILKWADYQEGVHQKGLQQLVETSRELRTNDGLCNALQRIGEKGLSDQVAICIALKTKVYTDPTIAKGIWKVVSDARWRKNTLEAAEIQIQDLLIESLSMLLVENKEEWFSYLPHYIADICEDEEDENRKRALFLYVIHTSLASDTVSAVRRLLRGDQKAKFVEYVEEYRARAEVMRSNCPPWVTGKLRSLMASMHVV